MTTATKKKGTAPKVKAARTNQRAILTTPVKSEAPPEKRKGGRKSKLEPIIEALHADPGNWYIVAKGKIGTVYQTRTRLKEKAPELEIVAQSREDDKTMGDCFARMPIPE